MSSQDPYEDVTFHNPGDIEENWAVSAFKFATNFLKLMDNLSTEQLSKLSLTRIDGELVSAYNSAFSYLDFHNINEDHIKNAKDKITWHNVLMKFKERIPHWNMATLIRKDVTKPFDEENCFIVPRVQFYMFELKRIQAGVYNK